MNHYKPGGRARLLCLVLLLGMLLPFGAPTSAAPADDAKGIPETIVVSPGGTLAGSVAFNALDNGYLSPEVKTERAFTHILLRTEHISSSAPTPQLDVRASSDGTTWTDWIPVPVDDDVLTPYPEEHVVWSPILYAGENMHYWQVRVLPPTGSTEQPALRRVDVNTVDTSYGSDTPQPSVSLSNTDKPPVVSRTGWGCPDGESSRNPADYRFANHMVVHHTAESNTLGSGEESWSDRVRAIWSYHAITLGWGDIGYNYIIDPNGVIYEGRAGGENAVGFHDTGNYGSMGVSIIGTYSTVAPTDASVNSLESLLTWKAAQNDIDPMGRSYYHGCYISSYCQPYATDGVVDNIAGHRQVTPGHTTCPGDQIMNLLPLIRNHVKERLAGGDGSTGQPDNGDLIVDELESSFAKSEATWYSAACGYGGHTYYTYTTDTADESTNNATWTVPISTTGRYRVYAYIPQGCGLGTAPYATQQAVYHIHSSDGDTSRTVDQNTADEWVDLGTYTFDAGNGGFVTLDDLTGEPYSNRRVIFFDSIKWLPEDQVEDTADQVTLLEAQYDSTTVAVGDVLRIAFTVKNNTSETIQSQEPQAGILSDGQVDEQNGYVYHEHECFLGDAEQSYPVYPKEHNRYRVMLGSSNRTISCVGETGGYPWRWGLNGDMQPGETRTITGYIVFQEPGSVTLEAGLIHEYVAYLSQGVSTQTITVEPEQQAPLPTYYDTLLRPLAYVYTLADMPDNLLLRTHSPLSVQRGVSMGTLVWDGTPREWDEQGPLNAGNRFLIQQTRVFTAPVAGTYTFSTTSSGGSWLWVDGQEVIENNHLVSTSGGSYTLLEGVSLHDVPGNTTPATYDMTGTVVLDAGLHVLSFTYYSLGESESTSTAGYAVQAPGTTSFVPPAEGLSGSVPVSQTTFATTPTLALAADDLGGSGIAQISYSWDGTHWNDQEIVDEPAIVHVSPVVSGTNHLSYRTRDVEGNLSGVSTITFVVGKPTENPADSHTLFLPLVVR